MNTDKKKNSAFREARRGTNALFVIAIAVLIIGALMYIGLGGTDAL
jgi:hypothetical protein